MKKEEIMKLAVVVAGRHGLDPTLVKAIVMTESNANPFAVRFEENWRYFHFTGQHARRLNITEMTERRLQMFSWGLMQVMGSVSRELGYLGPLPKLCEPELGLEYGCQKFKSCLKRWGNAMDAISAYNQGSPLKADGQYKNQHYVDTVKSFWDLLLQNP